MLKVGILAAVFAFGFRPAWAGGMGDRLCLQAGKDAGCLNIKGRAANAVLPQANMCPAGWAEKRTGACWTKTALFTGGESWGYVHPRGWVVDHRCFGDERFSQTEILSALETAWKKLSPNVPVSKGGCLSEFNPDWGAELASKVWENHMHVSCPDVDARFDPCASHSRRDRWSPGPEGYLRREDGYYRLLEIKNISKCLGPQGSGLAGVLFHETLHGADADNFTTAKHNGAWKLPQYEWARDRVYGAEAVCFFGTDPSKRKYVNITQCNGVVGRGNAELREKLCGEFSTSFTDHPPGGFLKH